MHARELGKTGLKVSPLGYGAFKIGRNEKIKYAQQYPLPTDDEAERLLNSVLDLGITYIDTAPSYGLSEERIGKFLGHRRQEFILSTKVGEVFENGESRYGFDSEFVRRSLHKSLKRLRTEILDIVFIHAPADDVRVLTETDVVSVLREFRQTGLIRAIGFSGKTVEAEKLALPWADVLMVEYHLQDTSHVDVLANAQAQQIGVVVKKGLAAGSLSAYEAIPFVLKTPGVSSLVVGGLSLEHLRENISIVEGGDTSDGGDLRSGNHEISEGTM